MVFKYFWPGRVYIYISLPENRLVWHSGDVRIKFIHLHLVDRTILVFCLPGDKFVSILIHLVLSYLA